MSRHWLSIHAPQNPMKATTNTIIPAAIMTAVMLTSSYFGIRFRKLPLVTNRYAPTATIAIPISWKEKYGCNLCSAKLNSKLLLEIVTRRNATLLLGVIVLWQFKNTVAKISDKRSTLSLPPPTCKKEIKQSYKQSML